MFVYEYLVERLRPTSLHRPYHYKEDDVEAWRTAVAGACAGMASWLPAIPFDVIKTKMMTASQKNRYKSVYHCYKSLVKVSWQHVSGLSKPKNVKLMRILLEYCRNTATSIYSAAAVY